MQKVITVAQAQAISDDLRQQGKKLVVVGGCFDILHIGHIALLSQAKQQGDKLLVLLESDEAIKKWKGPGRPINSQEDRVTILEAIQDVDYILSLPHLLRDQDYDEMILAIKPAIIATTKGDLGKHHKERQAALYGATVVEVTPIIANQSTTHIAQLLMQEEII